MKISKPAGFMLIPLLILPATFPVLLHCGRKISPKTGTRFLEFCEPLVPVCQALEPLVDRTRMKYGTWFREFKVLDMRSREGRDMVIKYRVTKTPTLVFLDDEGKEVDRLSGEITEDLLEKFIEENLKKK